MNKKRGKGLFHRIVGGLSAIALAITSFVPLTENLIAEAAAGQYYTSTVHTPAYTTNGSGSGMDAVYNITLSGNGENLNVFCIGYMYNFDGEPCINGCTNWDIFWMYRSDGVVFFSLAVFI